MMRKVLKYCMIIFTLLLLILSFQTYKHYTIAQSLIKLEASTFPKYLNLFYLNYDRTPYNLPEFKEYLTSRDSELVELMNKIEIQYKRSNKGKISIYHNGIDNINDSLKITYKQIEKFTELFYKKGDIEIDAYYNSPFHFNTIYKVGKDSIEKKAKVNWYKIYKDSLKCNSLEFILKSEFSGDNSVSFRIINKKITSKDSMFYGKNIFHNSVKKLFVDYLKNQKLFMIKDSVYFVHINAPSIKNFKCK